MGDKDDTDRSSLLEATAAIFNTRFDKLDEQMELTLSKMKKLNLLLEKVVSDDP